MTKNPERITLEEIEQRMGALDNWKKDGAEKIYKKYSFSNFKQALDFTNKVGAVAEALQHHPDIYLRWGEVQIEIYTHQTGNLTKSDFLLAEKIDQIN